jgi:ornithine cyclodeaminase/alanine dehydrogenase-like protein (mu-crystallin family)
MHVMAGALLGEGVCGLKTYTSAATSQGPSGVRFLVVLSSAQTGELLALIEADLLGRLRTGAASGVATRYLARTDSRVLGVYGAGGQAPTQIKAVCAVRPIERVLVSYHARKGRDQDRMREFCARLTRELALPVIPASAQATAEAADVVVAITTAREPVLFGGWLRPGTHVKAAGSNWANRREVDDAVVQRSALVAVDSLEQARKESGDLIIPAAAGHFDWSRAVELAQVVGGAAPGRASAADITLYKSNGIALQDLALAAEVYRRPTATLGIGEALDGEKVVPGFTYPLTRLFA